MLEDMKKEGELEKKKYGQNLPTLLLMEIDYYNLDVIISVQCRVKSKIAFTEK